MDRDRHGGNIKIDGNTINHFDFGMTEVTLASDEQKQALGKVIAQAVKDSASDGKFIDHLLNRIHNANVSPDASRFLAGFNREILALGDYFNALPADEETSKAFKGILGAALYGEHTDPVIRAAYDHELGMLARGRAETIFRQAIDDSPVRTNHVSSVSALAVPELTSEERAIVENHDAGHANLPTRLNMRIDAATNLGAGTALGAYGLYSSLQTFEQDMASGRADQQAAAIARVTTDSAAIISDTAGAIATWRGAAPALQRVTTRVAIPVAVVAGGFEIATAVSAGDRERAAGAVGATGGGILGGLAVGALAGAAVGAAGGSPTGPGAIVTGAVGGIVGGIGGAVVGEAAAKEYADGMMGWMMGLDGDIAQMIRQSTASMRSEIGLTYNQTIYNSEHEVSESDIEKVYAYLKNSGITSVNDIDRAGDGLEGDDLLNITLENRRLRSAIQGLDSSWNQYLDSDGNGRIDLAEVRSVFKSQDISILAMQTEQDAQGNRVISSVELSDQLSAALSSTESKKVTVEEVRKAREAMELANVTHSALPSDIPAPVPSSTPPSAPATPANTRAM